MTQEQWADFLRTVAGIIAGSVPGVTVVLLYLLRLNRKIDMYLIEHEMLISHYAQEKGIRVRDLPTRSRMG